MKLISTLLGSLLLGCGICAAHNPVVQTKFTTDPAPMVKGDTLYIYTGHDENNADFFWMQEWRVYKTGDMVNWTDCGSPLAIEDFSWGDDRAWAPQCIERNGKYYFYVPLHSKVSGTMAIGVAVGDTPTGPFKDPIGKPLADGSWDYIDPTVFIDDDGQAYLYWGNPQLYYAKLNKDMISFVDGVHKMEMDEASFGAPTLKERKKDKEYVDTYVEGPWISKRNGKYYMIYAAGGIPEHISYSMADTPVGPWKYMGQIMPLSDTRSFTNHAGVADFKGNSYFFYHTGKLPAGGGFGRSVAVEQFKYNPDGTIPTILPTDEGVKAVGSLNPRKRVEAETMAWSKGLDTKQHAKTGVYVTATHNGDYEMLENVDFGTVSPKKFTARVASGLRGGRLEVRVDSLESAPIAVVEVPATGGWEEWRTVTAPITTPVTGTHRLILTFAGRKGPELFNFDYWFVK